VDLGECHPKKRGVRVDMINTRRECEMVRALNNHEAEACPLQRIRGGQDMASPFSGRHPAVHGRDKLNIGGFGDGVPHDAVGICVLKPTVVSVVATKV
jgi:hypothetical protein